MLIKKHIIPYNQGNRPQDQMTITIDNN